MTSSLNLCKFGESIFCRGNRADDEHLSPLPAKHAPGLGTHNMPRVVLLAMLMAMGELWPRSGQSGPVDRFEQRTPRA
jgi:hypothetical protein